MFVRVEADYASVSRRAAGIIAEVVRQKPDAVLSFATGSTPRGTYRELIRQSRDEGLDFRRVMAFHLDEYVGLPANHPESYQRFLWEHLYEGLGLREEQTVFLDGMADDLAAECVRYEQKIQDAGGIDVQLLGIGSDGHIAFCEPGASLGGRTDIVVLHPQTVADNARFFANPKEVPRRALSLGVGTILEARCCVILANGHHKADAWAGMIEGPITSRLPASALQMHPWTYAISDPPAAAKLEDLAFYRQAARARADQPAIPPSLLADGASDAPDGRAPPNARGRSRAAATRN
jgi:glucosamine-6-phosphate deaminase